ncbi:hypothetical protein GNIT_3170 [Glaciecola nitratireducens FR1064]|uniref:Uncharacterized protein n=1 Tax=Glaciecola nitratireducens (strain JCM 12485 / KCTC 12276 / FR1064) TaxID=1085623 RepID=G4QDZ1_GLANF|nr:hypothetical protein GNIT_3170 [Glaciecola nitratireducens FR1064]
MGFLFLQHCLILMASTFRYCNWPQLRLNAKVYLFVEFSHPFSG